MENRRSRYKLHNLVTIDFYGICKKLPIKNIIWDADDEDIPTKDDAR